MSLQRELYYLSIEITTNKHALKCSNNKKISKELKKIISILEKEYNSLLAIQKKIKNTKVIQELNNKYKLATIRELECLFLHEEGKQNRTIARVLEISESMVSQHLCNVKKKIK